jgi:hypothetical protein
MADAVGGGGVEDIEASCNEESRLEVDALSARTVLIEGEGGIAVSEETTVAAAEPLFSAR